MVGPPVHFELDDGLHFGAVRRFTVDSPEPDQAEGVVEGAQRLPRQDFDRGVGALENVAFVFELLDLAKQFAHGGMPFVQIRDQVLELGGYGSPAGLFGEEIAPLVAHLFRRAVFVSSGLFDHCVDVHAALVGEGAFSHIGLPVIVVDV